MTINDLANIFYRNYPARTDWEELSEILWLYEEKLLDFEKNPVLDMKQFYHLIKSVENNRHVLVLESGDGIKHQALKLLGGNLLQTQFGFSKTDILYEEPFLGFEVDVIDRTLSIPIECGDTNAVKVEKYLINEIVQKMVLLPYPVANDKSIYSFTFTRLPSFKEYQDFKQNYSLTKLRNHYR